MKINENIEEIQRLPPILAHPINYNLPPKLTTHHCKDSSIIRYYKNKILTRELNRSDCLCSSQ